MTALCAAPDCEHHAAAYLCPGHVDRLAADLAAMPPVVGWLAANLTPGRRGESEYVSGSAEPPVPIRTDVLAAIGPAATRAVHGHPEDQDATLNIPAELDSWCRVLAEERGLTGPADGRVDTLAGYLLTHLDWITHQPWAGELADEVARMRYTAHSLAPWTEARHHLPAPCPSCDLRALVRYSGADHVQCERRAGGCGRMWTETEYQRLVIVVAHEETDVTRACERLQQRAEERWKNGDIIGAAVLNYAVAELTDGASSLPHWQQTSEGYINAVLLANGRREVDWSPGLRRAEQREASA